MAKLSEPVGPKSRAVYIRRRILVLLGLLAVVLAVVLIILKPGSSGGADYGKSVDVPKDLVETPTTTPADSAKDTPACESGVLDVVAVTDRNAYGAGESPQFSLTVQNTGKAACIADLGTAGMSFTVTTGNEQVWRSTDCQTSRTNLPVILDAGEKLETDPVTWDRTRSSAESCDIARDKVVAGGASYHLGVAVGGAESKRTVQFLLY